MTLLSLENLESGCIDIDSGAYAHVVTLDGPVAFGAEQPKKEIATTNNVVAMTKILKGTTNVGWLIRNFFNQKVKCCGQHIIVEIRVISNCLLDCINTVLAYF